MNEPTREPEASAETHGVIAWAVRNRVAPNLLMLVLIFGGLFMATRIKQEVFPEFEIDMVRTIVAYPGSDPEAVEQGIVLSVEEGIRGLDGIKQVTSTAAEGIGTIDAELYDGDERERIYQDIKKEVDRVRTFPEDAEEPDVTLITRRREVLRLQLFGQVSERALRELAEQVRDRLLQDPEITHVELRGARKPEVHVEVPLENLRAYGLTLGRVALQIAATSREIPGGSIETRGGEILLRVDERRDWAHEFAQIPIVATESGTVLRLEDIATVRDGFEDTDRLATYNGLPSIGIGVSRVGRQTPIGVSDAVRRAMAEIEADLPPGVEYAINRDRSTIYRQRLQLLMKNAFIGLCLVLLLLGAFLEFKLAFWVTMGIPTSFLGAFLFLPYMGASMNMISMFAFIIALGIVVDDAIVAGENIYEYRSRGMDPLQAAIQGARDVAMPIGFSIATNIVAFIPLYTIPGVVGKIWRVIPLVVISVFIISWVESLLILPSHLAHLRPHMRNRLAQAIHERQQAFSRSFSRFVEEVYGPVLAACLRNRYVTTAGAVAILAIIVGYATSGRLGIILMPRVESDVAVASARLPYGSPVAKTKAVRDTLTAVAATIAAEHRLSDGSDGKEASEGSELVEGVFALIDENEVEVTMYLTDPDVRPISTSEVTRLWRERTGSLPGIESLRFESDRGGPGSGAALTVELSHRKIGVLEKAAAALGKQLAEFSNVEDIDDGFTQGKEQFDFTMKPEGHSLGLTVNELARQVRHAFYGAEALRQQRGRNEVKLLVRLPENERASEFDIEHLLIRVPTGKDVPLMHVAAVSRGRAYTTIERRDGRRTLTVTADVVPIGDTNRIMAVLNSDILPALARDYPGLSYGYEGKQAAFRESNSSLLTGFLLAMLVIYALLVIPFRSYLQPLVIMIAIPFGMVGAVMGHIIMRHELSILSFMGMIALSGVVVNDALILLDYANRQRAAGHTPYEAVRLAGLRRFRPILLTTLTTFGGLAPMIFETSRQARFLVPMAISLGHGIVFATAITLVLVPSLYLIVVDILAFVRLGPHAGEELAATGPSAEASVRSAS